MMQRSLTTETSESTKFARAEHWLAAIRRKLVGEDVAIVGSIFLITIASRYFLQGQFLYHWDSVNFAFALDDFDVAAGQPHIPGYILYVGLLRLVNVLFHDAQASMVSISVFASGAAISALYLVGRRFLNSEVGVFAALVLASSPLYWFYGEIALPHALDGMMVIVTVFLLYRIEKGHSRGAVLTGLWLGVLGGFRPQTQVFLLPLALYVSRKLDRKTQILSSTAMVLGDLVWCIPLVASVGGLESYWRVFQGFYASFNADTSIVEGAGVAGLVRNGRKLAMYTAYGLGLASLLWLLVLLESVGKRLRHRNSGAVDPRIWFLVIWCAPSLMYYFFLHMGQQGLIFVFLPSLILMTAWGLSRSEILRGRRRTALLVLAALGNIVIYLAAPTFPMGPDGVKLLTAATLDEHDRYYRDRIAAVRANFDPSDTLLLSSEWRFPQYYLPEFSLLPFELGARGEANQGLPLITESRLVRSQDEGLPPSADGSTNLVLFDSQLERYGPKAPPSIEIPLSRGDTLSAWQIGPGTSISLGPSGISLSDSK